MLHPIGKKELFEAQLALFTAIILQVTLGRKLIVGPQFLIAGLELGLVFAIGITAPRRHSSSMKLHRFMSLLLIVLVSIVNVMSLILVVDTLLHGGRDLSGITLLTAAISIYATNIIMFGLWYWEIDSPGLTGFQHYEHKPSFAFPQSNMDSSEAKKWRPEFIDYLYVSVTNATAFSPTDTLPLTHAAKAFMGIQALISLLTLALVAARAVNILS